MCKTTPGVCVHLECAYTWSVRVCVKLHLECAYTWSVRTPGVCVCVYV